MRGKGLRGTTWLAGVLLAGAAQGQDGAAPPESANAQVTTLGEVRALRPDEEVPLDLYRFKSPVEPAPNAFNRAWREPPSLEEVGMRGGYLMMGINYGIAQTAKGLHTLTRAPDPIQSAVARPPPGLDADQQRRALQLCEAEQGCGVAVPAGKP
ncbi:hypothetical protein [uncultured Stenotrophomonas sp.]|uniref:hypothetical protein n=1 Tax=uncultured Stenotrophomonas sp. TaxID=165438 RepID=UPI0028EAA785|nr:hypothetical protein [uncultured Stenotrophomonas sp.]